LSDRSKARREVADLYELDIPGTYERLAQESWDDDGNAADTLDLAIAAVITGSEVTMERLVWEYLAPAQSRVSGRDVLRVFADSGHISSPAFAATLVYQTANEIQKLAPGREDIGEHYGRLFAARIGAFAACHAARNAVGVVEAADIARFAKKEEAAASLYLDALTFASDSTTPWSNAIFGLSNLETNMVSPLAMAMIRDAYDRGRLPLGPDLFNDVTRPDAVEAFFADGVPLDFDELLHLYDLIVSGDDPWLIKSDDIAAVTTTERAEDDLETVLTQLDALVGLSAVKRQVRELIAFEEVNVKRESLGFPRIDHSLHLVFTGPPGTGKTTVAKLVARAYAAIGLLRAGTLTEVGRVDLVAGYTGQTALKVRDVIRQARGGVLFIDEAYSLAQDMDSYGGEAIATLLTAMEGERDSLAVIAAGYTAEMDKFVNANPGLRSRFTTHIDFPAYSDSELLAIFNLLTDKYRITTPKAVEKKILETIDRSRDVVADGNARAIRNLFEIMARNMAMRAVEDGVINGAEITRFAVADVPLRLGISAR
jgi:AAA+ superfamily predicted ATPase